MNISYENRSSLGRFLLVTILLASSGAACAQAQVIETVRGLVRRQLPDGQLVPGVLVRVAIVDQSNQSRTAITGQDGFYYFRSVPSGSYTLTVSSEGTDPLTFNVDLSKVPLTDIPPVILSPPLKIAATGNIAYCSGNRSPAARKVSSLLARLPGVPVLALGDIVYDNGTAAEFKRCFDPIWAGLKDRTRPTLGNHDYGTEREGRSARSYFDYFGANAGPRGKGYYSFDLGSWHIVSLNSMAGESRVRAPSMAEQVQWLTADLKANSKPCILAFWHHPLFSSGVHGNLPDPGRQTKPLWEVLQSYGADVVVNAHDHHYERFAPQSPQGTAGGIREFVVGTGGVEIRRIVRRQSNSEVRLDRPSDLGVLLLTLRPGGYEWRFVRTDGTIGDESMEPQVCH